MATTYKNYYVSYNGTRIYSSVDNWKTSVNSSYNGRTIGEGGRTIPTSGYYCDYNVKVEDYNVPTAGRYCDYNIGVTTENNYRWQQFYAGLSYTYTNDYNKTLSQDGESVHYFSGSMERLYYHTNASPEYAFNTDGTWTTNSYVYNGVSTSYQRLVADSVNTPAPRSIFYVTTPSVYKPVDYKSIAEGTYAYMIYRGYDATMYHYYSYGYYYQGGATGRYVTNTNSDAYPNGGTRDGVYWYVAV